MADPALPPPLTRIFDREIRLRLFNRLLFFLLSNTVLYILLLCLLLLFNLPVYPLYLIQFFSLSLLPLYLLPLWVRGSNHLAQTLRRIDDQCLIESYLYTQGQAQRTFMHTGVNALLRVSLKQKQSFLRMIEPKNRYLLGLATLMFVLYILTLFLVFDDTQIILSPQELKSKTVQMALETQVEEDGNPQESFSLEESQIVEVSPAPESRTGGGNSEALDRIEMPAVGLPDSGLSTEQLSGDFESSPRERRSSAEDPSFPQELDIQDPGSSTELAGGGRQKLKSRQSQQLSQSGSPSYDAGKSFLESPLQEYSAFKQRLYAEGSQSLKPGAVLEEDIKDLFLQRLFGNFPGIAVVEVGVSPMADQIRAKYMRLIGERY